jgi:hypothetical protein
MDFQVSSSIGTGGNMTIQQCVRGTVLLIGMMLVANAALAQDEQRRGQGFAFGTAGGWTDDPGTLQVGAGIGGEKRVYKGFTLGADFSVAAAPPRDYSVIVVSANGWYHFENARKFGKWDPFVTAGVSAVGACSDECGRGGGFNVGGGVQYWFRPKKSWRVEFRDHMISDSFSPVLHKWEFRVGLGF